VSSITKVSPRKYRARFRTPDGASRSRTFERRADAEKFLATIEVRKAEGAYVDPSAGKVTFKDYAEEWRKRQPHRANTAASVEGALRVHVYPVLGQRPIAAIRPSELQAWVSGLGLAPSTVATTYGKVAAIFRSAVEDRLIAHSPCTRAVRLPRATGGEVVPMTADEVRAMAEAVSDRYRAFVVLLAGSALRPAEALGLTVDRVDWLRRTIRVDRQLVTVAGKSPILAPCKTESSVRTIPVPQALLDVLAQHLEVWPSGPDGLIFTDSKGDPIRRNAIGHVWRRAATSCGVTGRSPHDLRHYAASVMIDQGASVKVVQRQLGHMKATTTLDTYAHLWPESEDITRRALDAGLAQIVSPSCHEATG
jgi:integrase